MKMTSKINLSDTHINSYKRYDDPKFKKVYDKWDRINSNSDRRMFIINDDAYLKFVEKQKELKKKYNIEYLQEIKENGYIGCVGLAGKR